MKYVTVKLTGDQLTENIRILKEYGKIVLFDLREPTPEEQAHNAYIDRLISKLAQAKVSSEA